MSLIDIPLILVGLVLVAVVVRMVLGPTQADRAVSADLGFFCFVALAALVGARTGLGAAFDVVLIATLTGLVANLGIARLIRREQTPQQETEREEEST